MEEELYKQNILDHYKTPRNFRELPLCDTKERVQNINCGDDITLYIKFDKNKKVEEIAFGGVGCAISSAAASMLTEQAKGKTVDELKSISADDIYDMLGVRPNPARENCALLAHRALQKILEKYEVRN